jgi:hypothetical protein
MIEPIRQCEELFGMPIDHVATFQMTAAMRSAKIIA